MQNHQAQLTRFVVPTPGDIMNLTTYMNGATTFAWAHLAWLCTVGLVQRWVFGVTLAWGKSHRKKKDLGQISSFIYIYVYIYIFLIKSHTIAVKTDTRVDFFSFCFALFCFTAVLIVCGQLYFHMSIAAAKICMLVICLASIYSPIFWEWSPSWNCLSSCNLQFLLFRQDWHLPLTLEICPWLRLVHSAFLILLDMVIGLPMDV